MNEWLRFVVAALATWRVTHLIVYEDGPWDVIARLRRLAGSGFFGKLMDCFYCLSLWISAVAAVALAPRIREGIFLWLAISGAACLLNRIGRDQVVVEQLGESQGGEEDVLLRTESGESGRSRSH
jgi:hypothetical protein